MPRVPRIAFKRLELRHTQHWIWLLHENQSFLGRTVLRLKRPTEGSLVDLTTAEWASLRTELALFEHWLRGVFAPDRFNYAQLGNVYQQLHIHAVPRYRESRSWTGTEFPDLRWGRNWAPTPRSPIRMDRTYALAAELKSTLDAVKRAPSR